MSIGAIAVLFIVGAAGGALNAVAGGGSFLFFPTVLFLGVPPVSANATTAVALWPAGLASSVAYRAHLPRDRRTLIVMAIMSALGGGVGARILLATSDATFAKLIPWLLLVAATVFTFGPRFTVQDRLRAPLWVGAIIQLLIASYGGYFGGGMGILMLATYTLMGMTNLHQMNALKIVASLVINGVALITFLVSGKVALEAVVPGALGAIVGGFFGADLARRVDPKIVRRLVLVVAWSLTTWFFVQTLRK
jgi:uncharacterized membrane protein YfcA